MLKPVIVLELVAWRVIEQTRMMYDAAAPRAVPKSNWALTRYDAARNSKRHLHHFSRNLSFSTSSSSGCWRHPLLRSYSGALQRLGLNSQRVKKPASKLHCAFYKLRCCETCLYQTCPFHCDNLKPSLQVSWSPTISPNPLWLRSFMVFGTSVTPFPYIMWGVVFHCLHRFSPIKCWAVINGF